MTFDTVSISSDEDDVPLKMVRASVQMHPLSVGLQLYSLEHCEFCEQVSHNRYDALVHNAKHIIIPLLKQNVHQCPLCLYYFTSLYKLKHHTRNKHKNDVINKNNNETPNEVNENVKTKDSIDETKQNNDKTTQHNDKTAQHNDKTTQHNNKTKGISEKVVKSDSDDDDDLPLIIKKSKSAHGIKETEGVIKFYTNDAIKEVKEKLLKDVKVVLEKFEPKFKINNSLKETDKMEHTEIVANVKDSDKSKPVEISNHIVPEISNGNISSRLRFEDEIDITIISPDILKDLTTDCLVDMNLFDEPWVDKLANSITDDNTDSLVNVEDEVVTIDDESDVESEGDQDMISWQVPSVQDVDEVCPPSIHHEDLIKPGVFRCKRCPEVFPTRFNQIQHEMQHIHIRKSRPLLCEYCDWFIGNKRALKDHLTKHNKVYIHRNFRICKKCNLKYNNYEKHLENYHILLRCHLCNKGFDNEVDRLNHIRGHLIKTKCGQCDFVASSNEISEHQQLFHRISVLKAKTFNLCELCCLFLRNKNNMQYIFGDTVSELGTRLPCQHCGNKFFHLTQVKRYGKGRVKESERFTFEREKERKKARTNTDRLKNIQQRLKMINKLSRF